MRHTVRTSLLALVPLVAVGLAAPAQADDHVVADGLMSPLGFAVGSDGTVYVGEAFIGQLTAISPSGARTVIAEAPGSFISGVDARGRGTTVYTVSLPPEFQDGPPADTQLKRRLPSGATSTLASLLGYESDANPDSDNLYGLVDASQACMDAAAPLVPLIGPPVFPGVIESNPYAVALERGSAIVADAAGNDIVRVAANGTVSTVGVLPPVPQEFTAEVAQMLLAEVNAVLEELGEPPLPADAIDPCVGETFHSNPVPTDVEVGPDGDYYVSALPGFPESPGAGAVFHIDRASGHVHQIAGGLTGAVDLAVTDDGTIYVAELFAFQVSRIDPGDHEASASAFVPCPTAVEVAPDGRVLVAEGGICQDGPPEPGRIVELVL